LEKGGENKFRGWGGDELKFRAGSNKKAG